MSKLLSPLTIRDITFRNRVVVSPMCQYSSEDGFANDWHLVHLGSRAVGGAALIIQEATGVSAEGRISPGDIGIYRDEHIQKLQCITQFIHQQGAIAGIQLAHAGRKASTAKPWDGGKQLTEKEGGWITVAPSAIAFHPGDKAPEELDQDGIDKIIHDFKTGASRALLAGYKVIELHAAHGYLLHEFLSPLSNQRNDKYGGSFENRIRLLLKVVDEVRTVWPNNLPLFVRLSATDWVEGGWNANETVQLSSILKTHGVDLVDTSSGGLVPYAKIPFEPGYQVAFAERVKKEAGTLAGAVGLISEAQQAEEILVKEQADMIIIARASLRDPYFALHSASVLGENMNWPVQYLRANG